MSLDQGLLDPLLVLAPHTDDAELGCGGSLARLIASGVHVHVAVFSTADDSLPHGYPPGTLRKEFYQSIRELGLSEKDCTVFDYPVRRLSSHRQEVLEHMVGLREKIKPKAVFLPSANDVHQDHQVVSAEGVRAYKQVTIWGYELPWNHMQFQTQSFVRLSATDIEAKWRALQCYETQITAGRHYFQLEFVEGLARVRGCQIGTEYAEAFEVVRQAV